MDDVAVRLEHVHLLNGLDGLNVDLLEGSLELLVIASGAGRRSLDLSAGSTLATISIQRSPLSENQKPSRLSAFACLSSRLSPDSRGEVLGGGQFRGRARKNGGVIRCWFDFFACCVRERLTSDIQISTYPKAEGKPPC